MHLKNLTGDAQLFRKHLLICCSVVMTSELPKDLKDWLRGINSLCPFPAYNPHYTRSGM